MLSTILGTGRSYCGKKYSNQAHAHKFCTNLSKLSIQGSLRSVYDSVMVDISLNIFLIEDNSLARKADTKFMKSIASIEMGIKGMFFGFYWLRAL